MFLRYATYAKSKYSHSHQGLFQAAIELRDRGELVPHEVEWLENELGWLKMHLKSPACLREPGAERAICWFKPDALRPLEKVRSIAAMLEEKGVRVQMLKSADPGTVIYEDGWQVVAKPYRKKTDRAG